MFIAQVGTCCVFLPFVDGRAAKKWPAHTVLWKRAARLRPHRWIQDLNQKSERRANGSAVMCICRGIRVSPVYVRYPKTRCLILRSHVTQSIWRLPARVWGRVHHISWPWLSCSLRRCYQDSCPNQSSLADTEVHQLQKWLGHFTSSLKTREVCSHLVPPLIRCAY